MSNLRIKLKSYLDASIKKKDDLSVSTVRLIIAAIKDRDIEYRAKNEANEINDSEILNLLQNMIKQRNASIEMYIQGKRDDLVKIEEDEIKIISNFLPEQLSENEINDIITNSIRSSEAKSIRDMGKVINLIKEEYNGKMDFEVVSKIIKSKLLNL